MSTLPAPPRPVRLWVNSEEIGHLSVLDRGLSYGDGIFETMRFRHGEIPLLRWHMDRLNESIQRLKLPVDCASLRSQIDDFMALAANDADSGVIKLLVTRGMGGRGYHRVVDPRPTVILMQFPLPPYPKAWWDDGVVVRYCEMRLGSNPMLAGIKHLNRLEQVLARLEWDDDAVHEGLLSDLKGRIVEGITTNLFLVSGGRLLTPPIDTCGVAGVMRRYILEVAAPALSISTSTVSCERALLAGAQELFLCNALIGIWPVRQLGSKNYMPGPVTRRVQSHVAQAIES